MSAGGEREKEGFICMTGVVVLGFAAPALAVVKVKSLGEFHFPSDSRIAWQCQKLEWKDTPEGQFGEHWQEVLRFNRRDRRHFYGGRAIKVPQRFEDLKDFTPAGNVPGRRRGRKIHPGRPDRDVFGCL